MNNNVSQLSPIFIVGAPRSGTTLLVSMLGSHSKLSAGPETAFFTHIREEELKNQYLREEWPTRALELLERLNYEDGDSLAQQYGISEREQRHYLDNNPPSPQTLLESVVQVAASKRGKENWVEKTPLHLLYVPTILRLYPSAKIIRIVRDPRDSALSMSTKLPQESDSFITCCYQWMNYYLRSKSTFENNINTLTIRYEDLIDSPEEKLKEICEFISLSYESSMMLYQSAAKDVSTSAEHWKSDNQKPLTATSCYKWKRVLSKPLIDASSQICSEAISYFGYEQRDSIYTLLEFNSLNRSFIEHNDREILALISEGFLPRPIPFSQNLKIHEAINHKHCLVGPLPSQTGFVGKILLATKVFILMAYRKLLARPVLFLPKIEVGHGWLNRWMNMCVRTFGKKIITSSDKTHHD